MKSRAKRLVVLVVIVSFVIAACAGSQPAPSITVEDLIGVWHGYYYLQLSEDGTYRFADYRQVLEEDPWNVGQFRLEGTSLTFITDIESEVCAGQTGSYEIELTEEGQLQFELQEDPCMERRLGLPAGPWDRVEP